MEIEGEAYCKSFKMFKFQVKNYKLNSVSNESHVSEDHENLVMVWNIK